MHIGSGQSRVDFQVRAELRHGESLYVVGDAHALGNDLAACVDMGPLSPTAIGTSLSFNSLSPNAVMSLSPLPRTSVSEGSNLDTKAGHAHMASSCRLVTTPEMYPLWYNADPVVINSNTTLNYRYAICSGGKFVRHEKFDRAVTITGEATQMQDVLDQSREDLCATGQMGRVEMELSQTVVPRLSSGQAFVDRRATDVVNEDEKSRRGVKRGATSRILKEAFSIPEGIEEKEDENMMSCPHTPTKDSMLSGATHRPWHDDEQHQHGGGIGLSHRRRATNNSYGACSSPNTKPKEMSEPSTLPQNVTIESTDGVIIVVHRLPVLVTRHAETGEYDIDWEDDNLLCPSGLINENNKSNGLLYRDGSSTPMQRLTWVGMVHCKDAIPKDDEEKLTRQLQAFHCIPVFVAPAMHQTFHAFCYGTLWPIFHNIVDVYGKLPTRWWNPTQQKNAWSSYMYVNRMFVNKVIEIYNEGDLVWVHGLHLLIAPSFLARRLPCVNVGLFLHTPFPSSEIFRTLSVRADLLRGMLSADHIGNNNMTLAKYMVFIIRPTVHKQFTYVNVVMPLCRAWDRIYNGRR
jgi:trehalose 6-phosphate synthase/phosphatase